MIFYKFYGNCGSSDSDWEVYMAFQEQPEKETLRKYMRNLSDEQAELYENRQVFANDDAIEVYYYNCFESTFCREVSQKEASIWYKRCTTEWYENHTVEKG